MSVNPDGTYSIAEAGIPGTVLHSDVEADVDSQVLRSSEYPQHKVAQSEFQDEFGSGALLTVTHSGLAGKPDLLCTLRLYRDQPWGDLTVKVLNTTGKAITVQAIRSVHATGAPVIGLNGPESADRIISDSYSEDRPQMAIRDLVNGPNGVHRAAGSQLIYNRQSGESLFLAALTSDRFLTIFHLTEQTAGADSKILSYEAEATGTTEIVKGESLKESPAAEQVSLSLSVNAGDSLSSEPLMFAVGTDYHARTGAVWPGHPTTLSPMDTPTPKGWWSWTAYYFGLNQETAITNAE